jgi:hypothetical protein
MSRNPLRRRAAVVTALVAVLVAVLAPIVTAGVIATAGPAGAVPFEGDPSPTSCVRIVALPGATPAGSSTLLRPRGYAAVLVPRSQC